MAQNGDHSGGPQPQAARRWARRLFTPIVVVLATIYFIIDAVFLPPAHAIAVWIGSLQILTRLRNWIRSLGPYQSLALFLVPLIILEPVKPVAAYLFAKGQFTYGTIVLVVGEILKITTVERLFHISRDKLITIPAFAFVYNFIMRWLDYLKSLPAWQAVVRRVRRIKATARRAWLPLRARIRAGIESIKQALRSVRSQR